MKPILFKCAPALFMIAFVAFMWLVWLAPNYDSLKQMDDEEHRLEEKLAAYKRKAVQLEKWSQAMENREKKSAFQSRLLPDEPNLIGLMATFARQAADRGLVFSAFTPADPEPRGFYIATPIDAEFAGRLNDLVGLITASLDFSGLAVFTEYTLKKIPTGSGFRLDGHLETYHLVPEKIRKKKKRK